jgi:hypothetical protein
MTANKRTNSSDKPEDCNYPRWEISVLKDITDFFIGLCIIVSFPQGIKQIFPN